MAIVTTDDQHYKDIADEIRLQRGNDNSKWLPEDMAAGISTACGNQYNVGFSEGHANGFNEGMIAGMAEGKRAGKIELLKESKYLNAQASGTVVAVDDVSTIEHDVAVKVSSKNILPYPYGERTSTKNNITFTVNDDGSITINGTASAYTEFRLLTDVDSILESGEYYTLSMVGNGGVYPIISCKNKATNEIKYLAAGTRLVDKNTYTYYAFRLQINADTVVDNVTVYPQLEKGTVATPYTPYVESVEGTEVKQYGKNLLKTTNYQKGSLDITTGGITNNQDVKKYCLTTDFIHLKSGSYVLSNKDGANLRYVCFYNLNKEVTNSTWTNRVKEFKFSVAEDCYIRVDIERANSVDVENFDTFLAEYECQLELGTTATDYEIAIEPTSYQVSADGTATVKSLAPSMILLTDTENVVLECSYLRDIDTYIDNVMVDVALTGGE